MKKTVSLILCLAMIFTLSPVTVAAERDISQTAPGINGIIVFKEIGSTGSAATRSNDTATVTVSYKDNGNRSYTIYQYNDDTLIEEHTSIAGSGIVNHKFYNDDGTVTTEEEIVQNDTETMVSPLVNNDPYSGLSASASKRTLGYMHYRSVGTEEIFSINCYVIDEQHINQPYTFYKDTAKTLSNWISTLISIWAFYANPADLMTDVVSGLGAYGILSGSLTGVLTVAITKTVRCTYYNQELHGDPTQPIGRGKHGRLDGTYCYLDISGNSDPKTEGYTVQDWRKSSMGRWMMYKVFGMDVFPTSWTNTNH